jgi:uncharacterized protein (TIGR00369 family)
MEIITHQTISQRLCGRPVEVSDGYSRVELETTADMAVDEFDLVHGGFIFGQADYAAMIAVNDPNVVLGAAAVKFLKPVKAGQTVVAEARVGETAGKKRQVEVTVKQGPMPVFEGRFTCFVLDRHVLS